MKTNYKYTIIVMLVLIGALAVSAFGLIARNGASLQGRSGTADTSDFFFRHLKPSTSGSAVDTTDYIFRHIELFIPGNITQQAPATVHYGPPGR